MSVSLLAGIIPEFFIGGIPANGAQLFTYAAGTTTKLAVYTDSTGSVPQTNPILLNARGEPENSTGQSVGLWLTNGLAYKFVLAPVTDTDPPQSPIWTIDNIQAGQLNGTSYTAAGTNSITLTPTSGTPTPVAYANYQTYVFAAPATTTGPVTLQAGTLGYLAAYINGVQATTGQIQAGEAIIAIYNSALGGGAGGFSLYLSTALLGLSYGADSGAANAYVVSPSPSLSTLNAGQMLVFPATAANTTASTVNVSSLGAKAIVTTSGAALTANQIIAGQECVLVYNGTAWQLVNPSPVTQLILYAADTGAADAYAVAPVPGMASYAAGNIIWFKAANANTGAAATINVNSLGAKTLARSDITTLQRGDILAGGEYVAVYDGTQFQLLNPSPPAIWARGRAMLTVSGGVLSTSFASTGITSITRTSAGVYVVTFAANFVPDANYVVSHTQEGSNTIFVGITSKSSSGFTFTCQQPGPSAADTGGIEFVVTR